MEKWNTLQAELYKWQVNLTAFLWIMREVWPHAQSKEKGTRPASANPRPYIREATTLTTNTAYKIWSLEEVVAAGPYKFCSGGRCKHVNWEVVNVYAHYSRASVCVSPDLLESCFSAG